MQKEKATDELEDILGKTHPAQIGAYLEENAGSMISQERPFAAYMREKIQEKGLNRQDIFLTADISEGYGYKLLTEEKRTRQRDVILRLCYAAQMTLPETQCALKLYGMPILYARVPRDAALMTVFQERIGDMTDVNEFLSQNNMEVLRASGAQGETESERPTVLCKDGAGS